MQDGRTKTALKRRWTEDVIKRGFVDDSELLDYVEIVTGSRIPTKKVCPEHNAPAEWFCDTYFDRIESSTVWANRNGGKTFDGSILTYLESKFKPDCETKILGGSAEQSLRMYNHTKGLWDCDGEYLLEKEPMMTRTRLKNKSSIEILTASSKSVRGPHVPKLTLDEVDEFDWDIYEAALSIPLSKNNIPMNIRRLSTMHYPAGPMARILEKPNDARYKSYKWCLWEVIERCVGRSCSSCPLHEDCRGKAKIADGFYKISDAIQKKSDLSEDSWQSEWLCTQAKREGLVFKEFNRDIHTADRLPYNQSRPMHRGHDFGTTCVCLWAQIEDRSGRIYIIDEYYNRETIGIRENKDAILVQHSRYDCQVEADWCGVFGIDKDWKYEYENDDIGGIIEMFAAEQSIEFGIEAIRRALKPRDGGPLLVISESRCPNLIRELETLRFKENKFGISKTTQFQSGLDDHAISALRYILASLERSYIDVVHA